MNKKTNHKGFTITELVIVIAVVAILAAVLIPTFVSLIKKANTSADIQMVRNFNTIVAMETAMGNGEISPHEAIVAVAENGYKIEHITPTADERTIVFDAANYRFALLDKEGKEIFPKDKDSGTDKSNLFVVSDTYPAANYDGYAVYLTEAYAGAATIEVTTGVDTGYNDDVTMITYTGDKEVAVRGGEHTTIQVNSGTVHHYDIAWAAYENGGTYVEHGKLQAGKESGAYVPTGFAGGKGTKENPYLVATAEQFAKLEDYNDSFENGTEIYFAMIEDIVLNGENISSLNGTLDGNGHTITFGESFSTGGWPGLFCYTYGDTVIKDVEFAVTTTSYAPVTYAYGTSLTMDNVTVKGTDPSKYYRLGNNGSGLFAYGSYGCDVVLRNCVADINIENTSTSRAGLFIGTLKGVTVGGTATHGNRVVFENCVNKGTYIASSYVGFFDGSGGRDGFVPMLVNSPDAPYSTETYKFYEADMCSKCFAAGATSGTVAHDGYCGANWALDEQVNGQWIPGNSATAVKQNNYYTVCYINNCANEGVIIGNNSNSAYYDAYVFSMSTSAPHVAGPRKDAGEALTEAQFKKGIMIGADMKLDVANNNNTVTFTTDSTGKVDHYLFQAGMTFKLTNTTDSSNEGNEPLQIALNMTAAEAASFQYKHISKVVLTTDAEEYATAYEQNKANEVAYGDRITYVMVDQPDGSVMIIAKVTVPGGWTVTRNPDRVTYTVIGYDGTNHPIAHGSRHFYFS